MKTAHYKSVLFASTALSLGVAIAPAFAAGDSGMEEVVVVARRVEERLQDVPISIQVFNQNKLSEHNISGALDLARYTPSLFANDRFGSNRTVYALRGFNQETGTAPSVGVYFAEVVSPKSATVLLPGGDGAGPGNFFDLNHVEIEKGPQGTLFGINTTGGAVLLVPQKPTGKFEGYIQAGFGNYNYREVEGVINIPVSDKLRLRLAVQHKSRDGYLINRTDIGPRDFDDMNYTSVRASAVWDVTSDIENYTIFSYTDSTTNGSFGKLIAAQGEPFTLIGGPAAAQLAREQAAHFGFYDGEQIVNDATDQLHQWQIINTTTWNVRDNFTIKNIASYSELETYVAGPLIGANWNTSDTGLGFLGVPPGLHYSFFSTHGNPGQDTSHQNTITEEFRLNGNVWDGRLTWQGGAYFEFSRPLGLTGLKTPLLASCIDQHTFTCTDPFRAAFGGFPVSNLSQNQTETSYTDKALYAQATYKITEKLSFTAGVRYTWDHERWTVASTSTSFLAFPGYGPDTATCTQFEVGLTLPCFRRLKEHSNAPTWLGEFDYKFTPDYMVYAKYARGYRAGAVETAITSDFSILKPEKLDAYEVGAKTAFHGRLRGTFNVAAFYNDFFNQQLQLNFNPLPGPAGFGFPATAVPVNAGRSRLWGIEAGLYVSPVEGLILTADYTYLNTRILRVASNLTSTHYDVSATSFVPGDAIPFAPVNRYVLGAEYTLPLAENIGKVSFGATYSHTDSQSAAPGNRASTDPSIQATARIKPTDLVDLNFAWKSIANGPVDLSVFATNVFNQKYYTFIQGTGPTGAEFATIGQPAMYGVRVRLNFGK